MVNFKALVSLNISKISFGFFQYMTRDELFTKDEYELEISKMRKKLAKEMQDDIITERAKTINDAVKAIESTVASLDDELTKKEIKKFLTAITDTLFVDPPEDDLGPVTL